MNYSEFMGQFVLVQLKPGYAWIGVLSEGGKPHPAVGKDESGRAGFASSPILAGKLIRADNGALTVEYKDENGDTMQLMVSEDTLWSVTRVLERSIIQTPT